MAKNKLTSEDVNTATNELLVKGKSSQGISWEEAFDFAENQKTENMKALTGAEWLKLDDFGTFVYAFMGMGTAQTKEDGEVEVVRLTDREGKEYISSLAVLTSVCKQLTNIPTMLKIEYLADKKGTNGKYKDLKIFAL